MLHGLCAAGGKAVPVLIRLLKERIYRLGGNGGAHYIVQTLEETGDRRTISPLIEILSQPVSSADRNMETLRREAAEALAQYVMLYGFILKRRGRTFADGVPVTPREGRIVMKSDRTRIRQALQRKDPIFMS
ncbi:MAG: hypothetical protein OXN17_13355 [Candidatus Poribacteria bacterium]|nr:hypothetical protein [Candidatus Poribacteria bacterium]MDE0502482.1 hypothetical protein [Candidatus Poribacteria bacterium]